MRNGTIIWVGLLVLITLASKYVGTWKDHAGSAALQRRIQEQRTRQKSELAKAFFDVGVQSGDDAGFYDSDDYRFLATMPAADLADQPTDEVAARATPLGQTILFLSMKARANAQDAAAREARATEGPMAQSYRLYHELKGAPLGRQNEYVVAFAAGYTLGWKAGRQRSDRTTPAERESREFASYGRLTPQLLARTPDFDLEQAVLGYARSKIRHDWEHDFSIVTRLPKPIQLVFAMRQIVGEVDGDGFQHLLDCPSWQYAPLATEGYRLVGAEQRAALMERAIRFMDQEKAKDRRDGDLPKDEDAAFEALDDQFYTLDRTDHLEPLLIVRYIRAHPDQFTAD
jgi:hypothetical protein